MTELIWWIVALGLVVAIAGLFMLSMQIERHAQSMTAMLLHSNEMLLAQFDRVSHLQRQPSEVTSGVILERRCIQRRSRVPQMEERPVKIDQRKSSGRRSGDFPAPVHVGYSHP